MPKAQRVGDSLGYKGGLLFGVVGVVGVAVGAVAVVAVIGRLWRRSVRELMGPVVLVVVGVVREQGLR